MVGGVRLSLRPTFASLEDQGFRSLWLGTAFGHLGFWMQIVAQGWLAYELTASATFLGLVAAAGGMPGMLFMLPAGVIADRWPRRGVLIWTNFAMAVAALALAMLLWLDRLEAWMLPVVVFANATASAINLPARQSLGPQLVGPALVANSVALMALSFNASRWLGPAIAGALIAVGGAGAAFAVQAGCMVIATILTIAIRAEPSRGDHPRSRSLRQDLLEGLRYTWRGSVVRATVLVSVLHNALGAVYHHLMPVFAGAQVFNIGAPGLGALMASVGVGATVGAVVASVLSAYPAKGRAAFATAVGSGLAMVVFGVSPSPWLAMAALVIIGCLQTLSMTANQMILNLATPDDFRGRAMSIFMLTWNVAPLSALPAGWIADRVGAPLTVTVAGLVTVSAFVAAGIAMVGLRRFRDDSALAADRTFSGAR